MTTHDELIAAYAKRAFPDLGEEAFHVRGNTLTIITGKLDISLSADPRDGGIVSQITLRNAPEEYREHYAVHVLARFFDDIPYRRDGSEGSFEGILKDEIDSLALIRSRLDEFDDRRSRDLYYFYDGYCKAYNDSFS